MSKKSKSSSKPAAEYAPFIMGGANAVQDAYGANAGNIQSATNQVTGLLPSMLEKYQAGDRGINAARTYNTDVLSGRYLGSNPELDNVVGRSVNDTVNAGQAAMGLRGLTGGSSYADLISRNAGNVASDLRYGDYNNERARMATAAGQAPGIAAGDAIQIAPMLSVLEASQTPLRAAGGYAGSLAGLLSPYQDTTQQRSPWDYIMQAAGNAAQAAAMSDMRTKEAIKRVGQTDGGLPVYTFRYKGDERVHMGVMAQEVAALQPDALGPVVSGFQTVFYGEVN